MLNIINGIITKESIYKIIEYNNISNKKDIELPEKKETVSIRLPKNCENPICNYVYKNEYTKSIIEYKSVFFGNLKDFKNIIEVSQKNNVKSSIGTTMFFNPKTRVINQTIDGDYVEIHNLYEKIKTDYRHQIFWENLNDYKEDEYKEKCIGFEIFYLSSVPLKSENMSNNFIDKELLCKTKSKTIYFAKDMFHKRVLIKKFNIEKNKHAYNEINILNSIKEHSHIIKKPLNFETEDSIYLLYESVYPYDLFDIITYYNHNNKNINLYYSLYIFKVLINVSKFLYENDIIYCDYKPENICIDNNGEPILIDFDYSQFKKTLKQTPHGTHVYMSPEIINLKEPNSIKSDIWSIGCLFVETCFGRLPWGACSKRENIIESIKEFKFIKLFESYKNDEIKKNKYLKENCTKFFNNILCHDPEKRYNFEEIFSDKYFNNIVSNNLVHNYNREIVDIINNGSIIKDKVIKD